MKSAKSHGKWYTKNKNQDTRLIISRKKKKKDIQDM